jgi:hypothetical protein
MDTSIAQLYSVVDEVFVRGSGQREEAPSYSTPNKGRPQSN